MASPPTATTFFAARSTADKTKIQAILDRITAGVAKEAILTEASMLGALMGGDDRAQLMSIVYQQIAAR